MTPCHKVPTYDEKMVFAETECAFGIYSRCPVCHALHGEAKIFYTSPKGLRDAWTRKSQSAVREFYRGLGKRPLRFRMDKAGLLPVGFVAAVLESE